jgi:hypothetical protein
VTDTEALTLTCTACGEWYITDARDTGATLLHLPSGAHRVLGANGHANPSRSEALTQVRLDLIGLTVRLEDILGDLEAILAGLDMIPRDTQE